ncbi:MAG: helix-hairpin-helix domain-containing protein [bacterium]
MDLREIKGIGPAKQQKLRDAGIASVEDLARADPTKLAAASEIPLAQVREMRARAAALTVVQDAKALGTASVPTMASEAVKGLQQAISVTVDRLAEELAQVQKSLANLQKQAADAAAELTAEAKTPAGRKRIAVASRELAQDYAGRAQDAAQKAIAYVQANAPDAIAAARVQLEDAAIKLAALAEKTQTTLKTEAAKVKAANEKLFKSVKNGVKAA